MTKILYGAPVASAIGERTIKLKKTLESRGIRPRLATVRAGSGGGTAAYERAAARRCASVGVETECVALPEDAPQEDLTALLDRLRRSGETHGILLLRPLPGHMDETAACRAIPPEKDVDGAGDLSLAGVFTGRDLGFAPCTALACLELLDHYQVALPGARVAVLGRSLSVGRPLAMLLQARDATVTLCHSRTRDLAALCREQDILISAVGRTGLVDGSFLRPGQVLVDVGLSPDRVGELKGDARFEEAEGIVSALSPVPGGVGAVTTALLAWHTVQAAARQNGLL